MTRTCLRTVILAAAAVTLMMMGRTALSAQHGMAAPTLEDSPRLDEIVTTLRPVLEWDNSEGGAAPRTYVVQLDTSPSFNTASLVEVGGIREGVYLTALRLQERLKDHTRWFWRVRAIDSAGKSSPWGTECGGITARFFVNTSMDRRLEYVRVPVRDVSTSDGDGAAKIVDFDDLNATYWEGAAGKSTHWVRFDLGKPMPVSRIFLVSGMAGGKDRLPRSVAWSSRSNLDGRLLSSVWQRSSDGKTWTDVPGTKRKISDAYRQIFDLRTPVTTRYLRLYISAWYGRSPRVYDVIFYRHGQPPVPQVPKGNYVLVISDVMGFRPQPGSVKTDFGKMIMGLDGHVAPPWRLKVLELPARSFSVEVLDQMNPKPVAIFLTGSPNIYSQVPFFEFSGVFELARTTDIPTYGACAGVQLMAMAYGQTFVCPTGRSYVTNDVKDLIAHHIPPISINKNDPIFAGLNNPFYAPEFHSWAVREVPKGWEVLATSRDSKGLICNEMIRAAGRPVYGAQFHAEIPEPFSSATGVVMNFLAMAVERAKKQGTWIGGLSTAAFQ